MEGGSLWRGKCRLWSLILLRCVGKRVQTSFSLGNCGFRAYFAGQREWAELESFGKGGSLEYAGNMDVDDLSQDSDADESRAPYHIGSGVWMVPCTLDHQAHSFAPTLPPSAASLEHRQERQAWQSWEDELLRSIVTTEGTKHWTAVAKTMNEKAHSGMQVRHGKQCRERWYNHLDPTLRKGNWTREEDLFLLEKQQEMGNRWSEIARLLLGRNENSVKNRFKSLLRKAQKELPSGTDPIRWLLAEKRNEEVEMTEGNSIHLISPMLTSACFELKSPREESCLNEWLAGSKAVDSVKRGLRRMEQRQDIVRSRDSFRDVRDSPFSPSSFLA